MSDQSGFDPSRWSIALARLADSLGKDGAYQFIVAIGAFGAVWLHGSVWPVFALTALLFGGPSLMKGLDAYVSSRDADRKIEQLRIEQGWELVEKHRDVQAELPLEHKREAIDHDTTTE